MGRLLVVSGPSCSGKTPLMEAMKRFYPELMAGMKPLVLHNSRSPRPGELDGVHYHFRSREEIERLRRRDSYLVMDVRGDLQALDMRVFQGTDSSYFFEGNPFIGAAVMDAAVSRETEKLGVFISPMSGGEISWLQRMGADVKSILTRMVEDRLLRRAEALGMETTDRFLRNVRIRSGSAWQELGYAGKFQWVIPNRSGEDSPCWNRYDYPVGEALETAEALAGIMAGGRPEKAEVWDTRFPGITP